MRLARLLHQEAFGFPERHVGRSKADCYIHFKEFGNISVVIDYQRQVQLAKALKLLKGLHTQMVEFQRQHGPAKGPTQPDAPREAGSSS
ncbi:hypothetical protein Tco_1346006 [Tanacetum coccineum]